jgi:hypothetical protein
MTRRSEGTGSSEAQVLGAISQLTRKGVETKQALVNDSTFASRGRVEEGKEESRKAK